MVEVDEDEPAPVLMLDVDVAATMQEQPLEILDGRAEQELLILVGIGGERDAR